MGTSDRCLLVNVVTLCFLNVYLFVKIVIWKSIMGINKELLQLTLNMIKANPEHWDQGKWHCGTTHCFAGVAYLLNMDLPLTTDEYDLSEDVILDTKYIAIKILGITYYQANRLFTPDNTLEDLEHYVNVLLNTDVPIFSSIEEVRPDIQAASKENCMAIRVDS